MALRYQDAELESLRSGGDTAFRHAPDPHVPDNIDTYHGFLRSARICTPPIALPRASVLEEAVQDRWIPACTHRGGNSNNHGYDDVERAEVERFAT